MVTSSAIDAATAVSTRGRWLRCRGRGCRRLAVAAAMSTVARALTSLSMRRRRGERVFRATGRARGGGAALLRRKCERSSAGCGSLTRRRRHLALHHACSLWLLKGVLLDGCVGGVVVPGSGPRYGVAARVRDTGTPRGGRIWRRHARGG